MSAVDQAYRYAINFPCDWIIVTSMRKTRLSRATFRVTWEASRIAARHGEPKPHRLYLSSHFSPLSIAHQWNDEVGSIGR
jgi:hypothetical protein